MLLVFENLVYKFNGVLDGVKFRLVDRLKYFKLPTPDVIDEQSLDQLKIATTDQFCKDLAETIKVRGDKCMVDFKLDTATSLLSDRFLVNFHHNSKYCNLVLIENFINLSNKYGKELITAAEAIQEIILSGWYDDAPELGGGISINSFEEEIPRSRRRNSALNFIRSLSREQRAQQRRDNINRANSFTSQLFEPSVSLLENTHSTQEAQLLRPDPVIVTSTGGEIPSGSTIANSTDSWYYHTSQSVSQNINFGTDPVGDQVPNEEPNPPQNG
jgi:hypothetical protein